MTHRIVILFSGGMDSSTLLYHLAAQGHAVKTLSVLYGQRHARELDAAAEISRRAGVENRLADLSAIAPLLGGSSLTDAGIPVPEGHYAEESMKITVVPNRNMIMLSVAIGWAVSLGYDAVAYAAHSGDHAIYPDCRPEFADALDRAARLCDWREISLLRPFVGMDKGDIARRGVELGVPLAQTWTCYVGGQRHCGKCGACRERKEAFQKHGLADPTDYAA